MYALANFAAGDYEIAAAALRRALASADVLVNLPPDVRTFYSDMATYDAQLQRLATQANQRGGDRELAFVVAYLTYSTGDARTAAALFAELALDGRDTLAGLLADAANRALAVSNEAKPN